LKILQIVPRLRPAVDGIGDYALNLAIELEKHFKISTEFLVADPLWEGSNSVNYFKINKINKRNFDELLKNISSFSTILLHYVGYGYSKRGCPNWLINALECWRNEFSNKKLVTMFHEVYAEGRPPWTSAFWLLDIQKNLAKRLVNISDYQITNKIHYSNLLRSLSKKKNLEIPVFPVFSNIGEPISIPELNSRKRQIAIFGMKEKRKRVYYNSRKKLLLTLQVLGINKIIDIGPNIEIELSKFKNIDIECLGELDEKKIGEILLNSFVGFLDYNPSYLAKSGIYAAYSSHGILPVNVKEGRVAYDNLEAGKHYWSPKMKGLNTETAQRIATSANEWYKNHKLAVQVEIFQKMLV